MGNSLAVQWLGLCAFTRIQFLVTELRSHKLRRDQKGICILFKLTKITKKGIKYNNSNTCLLF